MMVNRYQVFADDGAGNPGELVAFAEQKRMKLREHVTLFADEAKRAVLAEFRARKALDVSSGYDVVTGEGSPIGVFSKQFASSLLRSTWQLEQPGHDPVLITERSRALAVFRRVWSFLPWIGEFPFLWKYHFDWLIGPKKIGSFDKVTRLQDHYVVTVDDETLDRRLVIAQAVALDALQSR